MTGCEFDELPYTDIEFYSDKISESKAEEYKNKMVASSFGAWQMLRAKGIKKGWTEYINALGFGQENIKKIDKCERDDSILKASSIHERLKNGR